MGQTWVYIRPESLVRDGEWAWPDEAECTANAHLIAAAPDLYAALEEANRLLGSIPAAKNNAKVGASIHASRAALAKSRGEVK